MSDYWENSVAKPRPNKSEGTRNSQRKSAWSLLVLNTTHSWLLEAIHCSCLLMCQRHRDMHTRVAVLELVQFRLDSMNLQISELRPATRYKERKLPPSLLSTRTYI